MEGLKASPVGNTVLHVVSNKSSNQGTEVISRAMSCRAMGYTAFLPFLLPQNLSLSMINDEVLISKLLNTLEILFTKTVYPRLPDVEVQISFNMIFQFLMKRDEIF